LAASLNNQSGRLSALGRREDAMAAIDEAVTAYASWPQDRLDLTSDKPQRAGILCLHGHATGTF
jgi:hypothetical protein